MRVDCAIDSSCCFLEDKGFFAYFSRSPEAHSLVGMFDFRNMFFVTGIRNVRSSSVSLATPNLAAPVLQNVAIKCRLSLLAQYLVSRKRLVGREINFYPGVGIAAALACKALHAF